MNLKKLSIVALCASATFVSCSKEEANKFVDDLFKLKEVYFPEAGEAVLNTKPTGNIVTVGNENKKEILKTVQKQILLNPVNVVDERLSEVIYPGSVLRGDSFMNGVYAPIVIQDPKDITISVNNLQGVDLVVKANTKPSLSSVRQSFNDLLNQNKAQIKYDDAPSYVKYSSTDVTTYESFNKAFEMHANANDIASIVKANLNYTHVEKTMKYNNSVLVKVRQMFYNISVDPKAADTWGEMINVGDTEPVYVSSVDYGRVAYFLVETNLESNHVGTIFKASVNAKFGVGSAEAGATSVSTMNKLFSENRIKAFTAGGPISFAKSITSLDSFKDFLEKPTAESLVSSSVPISYRIRRVKDNKEVAVRVLLTEEVIDVE